MVEIIVSRHAKIKRGKEKVNRPRMPKKWGSKPMGIIRSKE